MTRQKPFAYNLKKISSQEIVELINEHGKPIYRIRIKKQLISLFIIGILLSIFFVAHPNQKPIFIGVTVLFGFSFVFWNIKKDYKNQLLEYLENALINKKEREKQEKLAVVGTFLWLAHVDRKLSENELEQIQGIAEHLNIDDYNLIDEVNNLPKNINIFLNKIQSEDAKNYLLSQIIHFCFCDGKYDALERLSIFKIAREIGKSEDFVFAMERDYALKLAEKEETANLAAAAEKESQSHDEFRWSKAALVGGLTVGGGLLLFLTGGMAAPAVGGLIGSQVLGYSGAAAVSAGLATLGGGALAAGGLGMAGGTFLVSSLFGVGGALAAAGSANNLFGEIEEFKLEQIDPERYACHSLICIHGFLQQGCSYKDEWSAVIKHDTYSDIYSLSWESKKLKHLTEVLTNLGGNLAIANVMGFAAKGGLKAAGGLFALPASVISTFKVIDNPWSVARNRAEKAGFILGKIISEMKTPISLLGYSLGSRVIIEALRYLSEKQIYNKVFDVYLMAGAVSQKNKLFTDGNIERVVSNKFYNIYSNQDFVLNYLYRTVEWGDKPIGLVPLNINKIINIDVSESVGGHLDYPKKLDIILKKCVQDVNRL